MTNQELSDLTLELTRLRSRVAELESQIAMTNRVVDQTQLPQNGIADFSSLMLGDLIKQAPGYVFLKDIHGTYISANNRFCQSLGITTEEIVGKNDFDLISNNLARKYGMDDEIILSGAKSVLVIEEELPGNGNPVFVTYRKFPLRNKEGVLIGVFGFGIDISEHKKL